jgi:K+-transporting ATPase ATPase B chain
MKDMLDAAQLSSSPMKRRRAAASSCWPKKGRARTRELHDLPHATFVAFTAQTRMSGVDLDASNTAKARPNR